MAATPHRPHVTCRRHRARTCWRVRGGGTTAASPTPLPVPRCGRCPRWLIGQSVPRLPWDDPAVETFLALGRPVVLTGGCPLVADLVGRWSFDYLARHFGDYDKLSVHFAPVDVRSFARHYGKGLGEGGVRCMSFRRFVEACRAEHLARADDRGPARWRYYLVAPIVWNDEGALTASQPAQPLEPARPSSNEPLLPQKMGQAPMGPAVEADVRSIGWEWLARARELARCHPFDSCQMWAGHGGGATPLHFDSVSNFLSQVRGRKQVLLFPPAQTPNVYPFPVGHQKDNFAMVDVEAPDVARFPALRRARALEAVLEPGDVLFLPRFYWHYVHQLDEGAESRYTESRYTENLSLNFWVGTKGAQDVFASLRDSPLPEEGQVAQSAAAAAAAAARVRAGGEEASARQAEEDEALLGADDATALRCLHLARTIEAASTSLLKDRARGHQWLTAVAQGADAAWPEADGANVLARRIRRELMSVLGSEGANALLRTTTRDSRLWPGLAPPIEGQVVNSEKGQMTPPAEIERLFGDPSAWAILDAAGFELGKKNGKT